MIIWLALRRISCCNKLSLQGFYREPFRWPGLITAYIGWRWTEGGIVILLEVKRTLLSAFIRSRLDYCNSVFAGFCGELQHELEVIHCFFLLLEPRGVNAWRQFCTVYTGCLFRSGLLTVDSSHHVPASQQSGATVSNGILHVDIMQCCKHSPARHSTDSDKLWRPQFLHLYFSYGCKFSGNLIFPEISGNIS